MRNNNFFKKSREFLLDLFFPKKCVGCGREGGWLCDACRRKIEIRSELLSGYDYLDGVWVNVSYQDQLAQKLIHLFKYNFITDLVQPLSRLILPALAAVNEPWFLLPVPLHRRRLLARGFNQAELLAKEISQFKSWPLLTGVLSRRKYTQPQVKFKREKRLNNLKNVFICLKPEVVQGKNILLVDDVLTTGATLSECAKVLKRHGANSIRGLVVAHG